MIELIGEFLRGKHRTIWVNHSLISRIEPREKGSAIFMATASDNFFHVAEDPATIIDKINQARQEECNV